MWRGPGGVPCAHAIGDKAYRDYADKRFECNGVAGECQSLPECVRIAFFGVISALRSSAFWFYFVEIRMFEAWFCADLDAAFGGCFFWGRDWSESFLVLWRTRRNGCCPFL